MSMQRYLVVLGFVAFSFFLPGTVDAAHIFLETETDTEVISESDIFYVPVRIDAQADCVNAVSVALSYDPKVISVRDVSLGDSIITLWTKEPVIERTEVGVETGHVYFEGGIPGGYCGRVSGDPGQANILVKLVATGQPIVSGGGLVSTQIIVDPTTKVYLHDGRGTEVQPTLLGAELTLGSGTSTPKNPWLTDVRSDNIAPELFEIVFVEGPSAGNNKHYIVFNTTDKQSGVDHYEVLETDPDRFGFLTWVPKEAYWVPAKSPYVLRDQNLHSKIMVKAVDKNGNERIATYTPSISTFEQLTQPQILLPAFVILVLLAITVAFVIRFIKRRKKVSHTETFQQDEYHE